MAEKAFNGTIKEGFKRRYTIINEKDYEKYVSSHAKLRFENAIDYVIEEIESGRELEGKKPFNNYVVINLDEPYINEIVEIMKRNNHWN